MADPLVILPNLEALVSAFLRDQPEVAALTDDGERIYTAIPGKAGSAPMVRVTQIYETKLTSRPLWITQTQIQIESWGGTKAQALTLGRTVEAVMAARVVDDHVLGVVVGYNGGALIDLPDEDYDPARPRFLGTSTITAHPAATVPS
jgi:hypothetical protein